MKNFFVLIVLIFLIVCIYILGAPYCREIRYIITDCILDLDEVKR